MKSFFAAYCFLFVGFSFGQDTLRHVVMGLGSETFFLYPNKSFRFESHLCGFSYYSYGTYKKSVFGLKFYSDSTKCPSPSVVTKSVDPNSDSLRFNLVNMFDSSAIQFSEMAFFGEKIDVGGKNYLTDTNYLMISRKDLQNDSISVHLFSQPVYRFKFYSSASVIDVCINNLGGARDCGECTINHLRKTKRGYLYRSIHYYENREKPWKKGKRRVSKEYFVKINPKP